jgi:adenylyltransferase/sulfurtransferase
MIPEITTQQALRYSRQINLSSIDIEGQEKLLQSRVLILGLGGLGCAAAQYLAAAGVGTLGLLDFDIVDCSNLQRQILHTPKDIGKAKVESAAEKLHQQNPDVEIKLHNTKADEEGLNGLILDYDLVLDCSDNLETRLLMNQICLQHKTPLVSGAAIRMEGQLMVFTYSDNEPCYGCFAALFNEPQLSCVEAGVLSPLVGVIGSLQAVEAIKIIASAGDVMVGKMLQYDATVGSFFNLKISKNLACEYCKK